MQEHPNARTSPNNPFGGASGRPLLPRDVADFVESGVSIIVAVAGPDGRAQARRALAARVVAQDTIRLIFPAEGNSAVATSAKSGGPIAVTFSAPLSHRTIQIKGMTSKAEQIEPEDQSSAEQQAAAFSAILVALGYTEAFVAAFCDYRAATLFVLSFPVDAAFEQTPGPGAGRAI